VWPDPPTPHSANRAAHLALLEPIAKRALRAAQPVQMVLFQRAGWLPVRHVRLARLPILDTRRVQAVQPDPIAPPPALPIAYRARRALRRIRLDNPHVLLASRVNLQAPPDKQLATIAPPAKRVLPEPKIARIVRMDSSRPRGLVHVLHALSAKPLTPHTSYASIATPVNMPTPPDLQIALAAHQAITDRPKAPQAALDARLGNTLVLTAPQLARIAHLENTAAQLHQVANSVRQVATRSEQRPVLHVLREPMRHPPELQHVPTVLPELLARPALLIVLQPRLDIPQTLAQEQLLPAQLGHTPMVAQQPAPLARLANMVQSLD